MTLQNPHIVNIGALPNDGTGDNIRDAFDTMNKNFANISNFLILGPTLTSANITNLDSDVITANAGMYANLTVDTLTVSNVATIDGNLVVDGTITGNVQSLYSEFTTLTATDAEIAGNLIVTQDTEIHGKLTVFGNVTTITSSELIVNHPTIELGGNANVAWQEDDGNDRGVDFFWYDTVGNVQQQGFFGFQTTTDEFTYRPTLTSGPGNALFEVVTANIASSGTSNFNNIVANSITATDGFTGNLLTNNQPNVTSLGNLTHLNVTSGNITVTDGNVRVDGVGAGMYINGSPVATSAASFTGGSVPLPTYFASTDVSISTITGAVVVVGGVGIQGNLHVGGNIVTTNFATVNLGGTLTTNAQPNITSVGTLDNLTVNNAISAYSLGINNITAANFVNASVLSATVGITGTLQTAAQPNITSVGTLTALSVTGNITANSFNGNVVGEVTGNISGSASTVTSAAQPAITSVGTLSGLTVTGNVLVGNLDAGTGFIQTTGNITTTSNVTSSNLYGTVRTPTQPHITTVGSLTSLGVSGAATINGSSTIVGAATFASSILATGSGTQSIGSNTNRFGTMWSSSMNCTGVTTSGSFNGPINGTIGAGLAAQGTFTTATITSSILTTGNLVADVGTVTNRFGTMYANTFNGMNSYVQSADLAEMYRADGQYEPGTVVVFGGSHEVTTTGNFADVSVAGVVSTAPGYLMNSEETHGIPIALRGKVPCKVMGPVRKGDLLVTSAVPGYAESVGKDGKYGIAIFAKSLDENLTQGAKIINAVII